MKVVFIIGFILSLSGLTKAQCDTSQLDTVRLNFEVKMDIQIWDYFNRNHSALWLNVNHFDAKLIPRNGYATRRRQIIEGYGIFKITRPYNCGESLYRAVDLKYNEITKPIIWYEPPGL